MMERFFATCPRGLENQLADELTASGATITEAVAGGVGFSGEWEICYRANLWSRLATRILWRVAHGPYRREEDIYRLAHDVPWHSLFTVRRTLRVYMTAIRCPLKSLDFITLRIKDAVCDRFRAETGERPSVDTVDPNVRIHAFLSDREATVYLDTSGEPLYKRGFKYASVEAPLKENLAAGILRLAGWQPGVPLLDPMCGSGTFLLEAAMMAHHIAPGLERKFGFFRLANFDAALWQKLLSEAESRRLPAEPQPIFGSDISPDQVERARQNLAAAGMHECVQLECADLLLRNPPASEGVLVANPPYGVRLEEAERLAAFYPKLGDALKQRFAGWRCYFISADPQMPKLIGLKASKRTPLFNGALECRLLEYKMVSGQMRDRH
ncbi:MAG: RNA methyltransferase [Betaproteobacteria bacterium HGW-Betaproteobacteria-14]|nr:MAG: RNA methyltransferase [Betaproteobacteria bacterium HGW-Betaproteobacteria-14]